MKPSDIKVGATYQSSSDRRQKRTVVAIGDECRPKNWTTTDTPAPDEPGVLYRMSANVDVTPRVAYISHFAKWAGKEVKL